MFAARGVRLPVIDNARLRDALVYIKQVSGAPRRGVNLASTEICMYFGVPFLRLIWLLLGCCFFVFVFCFCFVLCVGMRWGMGEGFFFFFGRGDVLFCFSFVRFLSSLLPIILVSPNVFQLVLCCLKVKFSFEIILLRIYITLFIVH